MYVYYYITKLTEWLQIVFYSVLDVEMKHCQHRLSYVFGSSFLIFVPLVLFHIEDLGIWTFTDLFSCFACWLLLEH